MNKQALAVQVEGLLKSYTHVQVLRDLSFNVESGTVFALLGANGAGKTTIINILTTLSKADGGTAAVNGFDVVTQADKVRAQISLTGQFAAVDDVLTARENLVLIAELRHVADPARTAEDLLQQFSLQDAADRRAITFSGGMRRRLDIALGLIGNSPVVFLDEPTSGLDPQSRNMMWRKIEALTQDGTTVFLTTQNLEEADRLADRIAILSNGGIVAEGTPGDLKKLLPHGNIVLGFPDVKQMDAAATVFQSLETTADPDERSLTIATDGSVTQIYRIFNQLQDAHIDVSEFSQKAVTLDDAFLKIVSDHEVKI